MKSPRPCTAGPGGWSGRRGGDVAFEGRQCWSRGTPSWEHTSEGSICSLRQSPDGQESPCQDPAGCPSYWICTHTHIRMPHTVTQAQTNINRDVQYTHTHTHTHTHKHTHTHYSCNWKLCSGGGMSGDVRSHFSTHSILLSSLTRWPWGQSRRPWLHTGGSVQPLDRQWNKPSPFEAALPRRSMPIHPKEQGWDYSKTTRETLFVFLLWRERLHSHL